MDHSYEEIRNATLDLLAGRERAAYELSQYQNLLLGVSSVFLRRETGTEHYNAPLSSADREKFLEVFWGLFREGVITLGFNDSNREFPFFRVSEFGKRLLDGGQAYFFHDVSSYEKIIRSQIPNIDDVTLIYVKEAMQAFKTGCILSSTVMLGVATEHTFLLLIEKITQNSSYGPIFDKVNKERTILAKVNKFKNILEQYMQSLPSEIKEDIDTNFDGILSIIRNFRNQSGHPTGNIIDREQAYILLQLFVPYCKKMYQLMTYYSP
jgi:hypothetical protein